MSANGPRRGLFERPLLLFGCLLLLPALGFSWLGWQSLTREQEALRLDRRRAAREALEAQAKEAAASLDLLAQREAQRPYYDYQREILLIDAEGQNLVPQPSSLARPPEDPRILGWFQWEAGPKGAFQRPELFAPEGESQPDTLEAVFGPTLRQRLEAAALDAELRSARQEDVPLALVMANEERGQLLEELEVRRRLQGRSQGAGSGGGGEPLAAPSATQDAGSGYLKSFFQRASADPVPVRYTRLQALAAPAGAPGAPLVLWRLVWVPAVFADRRETHRDRWLLQGVLVDPARAARPGWTGVGSAQVGWAARLPTEEVARAVERVTLVEPLRAEQVGDGEPTPALTLVARPDEEAARDAWHDARVRFFLLVAALVSVVALGFVVLLRGVRKEVALARRKEDFVAAVTHELKTPLTGIRMHAEMLEQGWVDDPDAAAGHARKIIEECGRLGHLVDQVLDLAALERGVSGPQLALGDMGAAVEAAVGLLRSRADKAGVTLEVVVEPGLPPAPFDPRLLRPLVLNLVENAIKYSERSSTKEVRVSLARQGDRLALAVADRGIGIAPEAQSRLFQPFHREGDEMTRAAPGVGIGLALVKRYADVHRARVALESAPGLGTTVTVRFPT
jgi:signal transduction histidine kinase